ncbi:MAG: SH3 domain-containing protein [Desulfococcaceae bacterium]
MRPKNVWISVCLAALLMATAATGMELMNVQVREGQLRTTPSFLGKVVATLPYGAGVGVLQRQGDWIRVGLPTRAQEGWMHSSALTEKNLRMAAGADDVEATATGDELALAGKGFNQQVEQRFRAENPDKDFTWVDRMETWGVSAEELADFLREGELIAEGETP